MTQKIPKHSKPSSSHFRFTEKRLQTQLEDICKTHNTSGILLVAKEDGEMYLQVSIDDEAETQVLMALNTMLDAAKDIIVRSFFDTEETYIEGD